MEDLCKYFMEHRICVNIENSVDLEAFAIQSGVEVTLYSIESADHTEGILLEPDLYYQALGSFFSASLLN